MQISVDLTRKCIICIFKQITQNTKKHTNIQFIVLLIFYKMSLLIHYIIISIMI